MLESRMQCGFSTVFPHTSCAAFSRQGTDLPGIRKNFHRTTCDAQDRSEASPDIAEPGERGIFLVTSTCDRCHSNPVAQALGWLA
jgi:hypothetical protein